MIYYKTALLLAAVLLCLCLEEVPANEVSVKFTTPQPSCVSENVNLICNVSNSSATFIRWNITELGNITFYTDLHEIGNVTMLLDRVIANLTETSGGLVSSLTILPPLNNIQNSNLNNTIINCTGGVDNTELYLMSGAQIKLYGEPSPPTNPSVNVSTSSSSASVKIEWYPSVYSAVRQQNRQYRINIYNKNSDVSRTVNRKSSSKNEYLIESSNFDSFKIKFNIPFDVSITNVDACGINSVPAETGFKISAYAPPKPSLNVTFDCSVKPLQAFLQWQYSVESRYTPPFDVTVEANSDTQTSIYCDGVSIEGRNCTFGIATNTTYTVAVNLSNAVGLVTSNDVTFNFLADLPFFVDDSGLAKKHPYITVSLNSLCLPDNYTITVDFGVISSSYNNGSCKILQNVTMINAGKVKVPPNVTLEENKMYCYAAVIQTSLGYMYEVSGSGGSYNDDSDSDIDVVSIIIGVAIGAGFVLYVIIVSITAVHFYWYLPDIKRDNSFAYTVFYSIRFILSVVLFPIGIIWLVLSKGKIARCKECYSSPHNSAMTTILCCIGIVASVIIFPLGIFDLVLLCKGHKHAANGLVRSAGIVMAIIVFPIGLVLLVASCIYTCLTEQEKPHAMKAKVEEEQKEQEVEKGTDEGQVEYKEERELKEEKKEEEGKEEEEKEKVEEDEV